MYTKKNLGFVLVFLFCSYLLQGQNSINRKAVVERHIVKVQQMDTLASLSVGNGKFAFTVDATGLQTFPEHYAQGIPLGTQSEWGWHTFPNTNNYRFEESLKEYTLNGKKVSYGVQINSPEHAKQAVNYFRQNPHRLQLGNLGFILLKSDGTEAKVSDILAIDQSLNPWTGEIQSQFVFDNQPVKVQTLCSSSQDLIALKVESPLLQTGQLKIQLRFPFPSNEFLDSGVNRKHPDQHQSALVQQVGNSATILHQLDNDSYFVQLQWQQKATISQGEAHQFVISPEKGQSTLELSTLFSAKKPTFKLANFMAIKVQSMIHWQNFWKRGGAIDFAGSTDPRANELERRIVLSQYLTKIQCTSAEPPQETGLTYNSWYGKPHLEMHWWHGIHFALWGRIDLLEKSLGWYAKVYPEAKKIAQRQGYDGVRWQKMTDPAGQESPSSVGAFLIWQQPHFIYFAELVRRQKPQKATLLKYKDLVFATADFMASYPHWDTQTQRYILGKGLIPAQERFNPEETFNPTYELVYWHWALTTAQAWRKALGLAPNPKYSDVLNKLSPLPIQDGVYLATESAKDSYTNPKFLTDHPAVLGALGMLPQSSQLDITTMQRTFDKVWETWQWHDTWGWDFPMVGMTAARLGNPEKAIDGLMMNIKTNTYLVNGHNFQDERLRLYLPGNGGLLATIAMMCTRDDLQKGETSFPKNGKWQVKWEGLQPMP
jgi:hypothetical protein